MKIPEYDLNLMKELGEQLGNGAETTGVPFRASVAMGLLVDRVRELESREQEIKNRLAEVRDSLQMSAAMLEIKEQS